MKPKLVLPLILLIVIAILGAVACNNVWNNAHLTPDHAQVLLQHDLNHYTYLHKVGNHYERSIGQIDNVQFINEQCSGSTCTIHIYYQIDTEPGVRYTATCTQDLEAPLATSSCTIDARGG